MVTTDNLDPTQDSSKATAPAPVTEINNVDPVASLKQLLNITQDTGNKTDLSSLSALATAGIYAANDSTRPIQPTPGQTGDLTITPAFAPDQKGAASDRHVASGPWDVLEVKNSGGPGALHFDSLSVPSKADTDGLVLRFNEESKDGKLSADPAWQKYLDSLLPAKADNPDWQAFLKDLAGKHSNDPLLQKLADAKNDPALTKQLDDLQRQLQQSPAWKQFLQASEVKQLHSGQADPGLQKYLDAHPEVAKPADAQKSAQDKQVDAEHKRLGDWADKNLTEPDRSKFKKDMTDFEERAKRDGLSQDEILKTYKQIDRLAEATGNEPLSPRERQRLAQEVMHQVAVPTSVGQGAYNTCNVASVESRTYTRSPSDAARLVTDVALTGQYRAADGTCVRVDTVAHGQSRIWPTQDGTRNHASEIFQVTAIDLHYAKANRQNGTHLHYEQRKPDKGDYADNGERLIDYSKNVNGEVVRDGKKVRQPDLSDIDIADISNQITGRNEKDILLQDPSKGDASGGVTNVKSQAELEAKLKDLKAHHQLPVIVWVDTQNEPFYTDSGRGAAGGSGGAHVVTITDYDEKTGKVCIDNEWDKSADHGANNPVSTHDLFIAMHSSADAEKLLNADVQYNRAHGIVDPTKEFDLLRHRMQNKDITPEQAEAEAHRLIAEEGKRIAKGNVPAGEKEREWAELSALIHNMDPGAQIRLVRAAHAGHLIDNKKYEDELQVLIGRAISDHIDFEVAHTGKGSDEVYNKRHQDLENAINDLPPPERKPLKESLDPFDQPQIHSAF